MQGIRAPKWLGGLPDDGGSDSLGIAGTQGGEDDYRSGRGIVKTPSARGVLKDCKARRGPTVHISRDIKEIVRYLTEDTERPAYGEEIEEVYNRRRLWFHECSSHEFVSLTTITDVEGRLKHKLRFRLSLDTLRD